LLSKSGGKPAFCLQSIHLPDPELISLEQENQIEWLSIDISIKPDRSLGVGKAGLPPLLSSYPAYFKRLVSLICRISLRTFANFAVKKPSKQLTAKSAKDAKIHANS